MSCPTCSKPSLFAPSNPWRPFCSERCKTNDLGAWASESYRIPAKDEGTDPDFAKPGADPEPGEG